MICGDSSLAGSQSVRLDTFLFVYVYLSFCGFESLSFAYVPFKNTKNSDFIHVSAVLFKVVRCLFVIL